MKVQNHDVVVPKEQILPAIEEHLKISIEKQLSQEKTNMTIKIKEIIWQEDGLKVVFQTQR